MPFAALIASVQAALFLLSREQRLPHRPDARPGVLLPETAAIGENDCSNEEREEDDEPGYTPNIGI